jgi:hypothetical protein
MLATYSLLPIIQRFAKPMGVEVMRKNAQFVFLKVPSGQIGSA